MQIRIPRKFRYYVLIVGILWYLMQTIKYWTKNYRRNEFQWIDWWTEWKKTKSSNELRNTNMSC